jgi:hypothetical protein
MEYPQTPVTPWPSQPSAGNSKVALAFAYFATTAMFLALFTLAGAHFDPVIWSLTLAYPLVLGITGWDTGGRLTDEEARQQADISRWDV